VVRQVGSVSIRQQEQLRQRFQTQREIPMSQGQPARLYVSVDGTHVHEQEGWHEAKMGCVYGQDEPLGQHKCYVGRFCTSEEFGWHMWVAACQYGLREALEVVYLGDGAAWVRVEHDRHFQRAIFIVDWCHASEHVWDCGKALWGDGTTATKHWVEEPV